MVNNGQCYDLNFSFIKINNMELTGEYNEKLKNKAIKEASEIFTAMVKGDATELFAYTMLSWRIVKQTLFFVKRKHPKDLHIPKADTFQIHKIHFHSPVTIDVYVQFDQDIKYSIRMVAEKEPYKTDPEAKFRYNPNGVKKEY